MDGNDCVERVGLAAEHGAGFQLFSKCGEGLDVALKIGKDILAFADKLKVCFDVAGAADEFVIVGDEVFQALAVAHDWFGRSRIVPEGWIGELGFYCG
jgi:hypothetical protein